MVTFWSGDPATEKRPPSNSRSPSAASSMCAAIFLALGRGSGHDLDLAGGEHLDLGRLPAGAAGAQRGEHLGGGQTADLGVRREADAELYGVTLLAPATLLLPEPLVVGELYHPVQRRLHVHRVVLDPGRSVGRLVERLVEVTPPDLSGVEPGLAGKGVHD